MAVHLGKGQITISVQVCVWWVKRQILHSCHTAERYIWFWMLQISFEVKKKRLFLLKEENAVMKHFCVSYFSLLRNCFLKEPLSQLFLQLLIVLGFPLHVSYFWFLLGFLPVPFSSSPLEKKKSFLCILTLFSLGRRQKGSTPCGKVTTCRPVNTKWRLENQMLSRSGDTVCLV